MKKIAVCNPNAGKGLSKRLLSTLIPVLQNDGIEIWMTRSKHDAEHRIRDWCNENPDLEVCFIISGGDGTMHEAVNGAAGHQHASFASIPTGSGNDFARYFGGFELDQDLSAAMERSTLSKHDVIRYKLNGGQTRTAVSNMGAGFDAEVAFSANQSPLKKLLNKLSIGKVVYVLFLVRQLMIFKPYSLEVTVHNKTFLFDKVWFATISNQPYYGGGMKIAPKADTRDGELDLTIVHGLSRIKFLFVFLSVFKGTHTKFKEVYHLRSEKVDLKAGADVRVHADGEDNGLLKENQRLTATAIPSEILISAKLALDES
ncbi:diacylglycerol/lipid kinase family protein [Jeotgalibacillus salarius]|uniref:Diacylglycerol kinase family lipid kinase n=1 Tax=Jeotgalibacillus salarius TaxID=546023 RepID=A0A4Y8L9X8_9BACL|nr:diacylglycerol kinase family protein [Jeotgalibacillus salarius]TFD98272.1 diacylglycerol kinase family lipid kinase [Jeotgalibacillus salarius]